MKNEIVATSLFHDIGQRGYQEDSHSDITLEGGVRAITVCDGLGGHWGGAQASSWIAKHLPSFLTSLSALGEKNKARHFLEKNVPDMVRELFYKEAGGGKTTLASLVWDPSSQDCYFFSCGDSHVMHFRPFEDSFTLVMQSPIEGVGNVVYNCLSSSRPFGEIRRLGPFKIQKGDVFIIASDGINPLISDLVEEATIGFDDLRPRPSQKFLKELATISPGGKIDDLFTEILKLERCDNVTAQVVWF